MVWVRSLVDVFVLILVRVCVYRFCIFGLLYLK